MSAHVPGIGMRPKKIDLQQTRDCETVPSRMINESFFLVVAKCQYYLFFILSEKDRQGQIQKKMARYR